MLLGLIPAAGKSTRMGQPKLSLPLGDRTVIEHVIAAVRAAGIDDVLAVVGPHVPELVPLAESAGAHTLFLPEETPDMRATIQKGLAWLEERFHPGPDDAWLLLPADHPTIAAALIRRVVDAAAGDTQHSIVIPIHSGKRGHPTLLRWSHVAGIRALPDGVGLNVYLRQHAAEVLEVPVEAADVDLDTPEEYEKLLRMPGAPEGRRNECSPG